MLSRRGKRRIVLHSANPTQKDLAFLKDLLEAGKLVPVIERTYPLGETSAAMRYLEEGHPGGKVVITV
jgi:NADPH:quinone reductase-like Zn-dependent oxidoreductase